MPLCTVSYTDSDGIKHTVEIQADSLYEAAVLAIKVFKQHDLEPGPGTKLQVAIPNPVTHEITYKQIKDWLKRPPRNPRDVLEKERLKEILGMKE